MRLQRSPQQPFFSGLEVRKRIDTRASILSHQRSKPSRVKLLWPAKKRDFYPVAREYQQSFSKEESINKGDFYIVSRSVDEKFIVPRALAMFSNRRKLQRRLARYAYADKPCGEITGHLYHLKLKAHLPSAALQ